MTRTLSDDQVRAFQEDGFLLVPGFYTAEEMDLLLQVARSDMEKTENVRGPVDAAGRTSKLWLTSDTDRDDVYNAVCHGRRLVDGMARLMQDEVYLYHYKMMVKEPRVGGAWEWHQDYGYWYNNGCLYPDMASVMVALDRCTRENGCLQVLRGSHRMGRIDHGRTGDQTGADLERIAALEDRFDLVHCEMEPGTALFFHSNTLHRSDPNESPDPRWALICCYTATHNPPFRPETRGDFSAFERWNDERVRAAVAEHDARLSAAAAG